MGLMLKIALNMPLSTKYKAIYDQLGTSTPKCDLLASLPSVSKLRDCPVKTVQ